MSSGLTKLTFLFWNLNKKHLEEQIYNLSVAHKIDVLFFAECTIEPTNLLQSLNREEPKFHFCPIIGCEKIKIFTRFPSGYMSVRKETSRMTIRELDFPGLDKILIAIAHLPSKNNWSDSSQAMECTEVSRCILEAEEAVGHQRTMLVGDLNMHPFETGVVAASGLHAVMSRDIAKTEYRILNERRHTFFYNPMWSLLGSDNPFGSYYYNSSEQLNYYWGILDQVLLRPSIIDNFDSANLKILTTDGCDSFLTANKTPNRDTYSDHLPLLFSLFL